MNRRESILIDYSIAVEDRDICDGNLSGYISQIKEFARHIVENNSESFFDYSSDVYNIASVISSLETYSKMRAEHAMKASTIKRVVKTLGDDDLLSAFGEIDSGKSFNEVYDEFKDKF